MLPSNKSPFQKDSRQQGATEEDPRQHYNHQNQPQAYMQNSPWPTLEQHQFEQNRQQQHVQTHQNQIHPVSNYQPFSYNQAPLRADNNYSTYTPQYPGSLQNASSSTQPLFASNPPSMGYSSQDFSGQLEDELAPHGVVGNLAQVVIRAPTARRRGRPPKNPAENPSHKSQKSIIPKRRGRPPKDYTSLVTGADSETFMANEKKPSNKKKPNSQSDDNPPKRRGRPPKQPSPEKKLLPLDPMFPIYKCEWHKCSAELHNLATLRLHLSKLHSKRENGMFRCLWKGCSKDKDGDKSSPDLEIITQYEFKDEDDWKKHLEKKHILRYAWHMGDGPTNSLDGTPKPKPSNLPAYLFDKNGVQVTPSLENHPIEYGDPRTINAQRFKRTLVGLDFVLDPIYNSNYTSPMVPKADDIEESNKVNTSNEDEDENEDDDDDDDDEDDDTDMDIRPGL